MDNKLWVRPAAEEDLPQLEALFLTYYGLLEERGMPYSLEREALGGVLKARLKSRMFHVLAAERDGKIGGFLICSILRLGSEYRCEGQGVIGYINEIYASPACRGAGRQMLAAAEDWLREQGVASVEANTLWENREARRFFQGNQYGETAVVFKKKL